MADNKICLTTETSRCQHNVRDADVFNMHIAAEQEKKQNSSDQDGKSCGVVSGPAYTEFGKPPANGDITIKAQTYHDPVLKFEAQFARFTMDAKFATDAKHDPSCCRVHQYIKWDSKYQASNGGKPLHSGFPNGKANRWYEDTDATQTYQYGNRNKPHAFSQYLTNGHSDSLHSDTFHGYDAASGGANLNGEQQALSAEHSAGLLPVDYRRDAAPLALALDLATAADAGFAARAHKTHYEVLAGQSIAEAGTDHDLRPAAHQTMDNDGYTLNTRRPCQYSERRQPALNSIPEHKLARR